MDCKYSTISKNIKLKEFTQKTTLMDDDSTLENSMDSTIETVTSDYSDLSVGNAFGESDIEINNVLEDIGYNISVARMKEGGIETPATIYTANTSNTLRSL